MADEYIKRSDALRFALFCIRNIFDNETSLDDKFKEIPSADVAEVVRCKDCSHAHKTSFPSELRICLTTGCFHSENHFCSDGKRMDGK